MPHLALIESTTWHSLPHCTISHDDEREVKMPPKKKAKKSAASGPSYTPKNILVTGGAGFM